MAGFSSTVLELTPSDRRTSIPSLLDRLQRSYDAQLHRHPSAGARPSSASGTISLGTERIVISVEVGDEPTGLGRVNVSVELDEQAYETAFDIFEQKARAPGKQLLIDFCVDVAAAARVDGFRLRFSKGPRSKLTVEELAKALTAVDRNPGLVSGIASSLPASSEMKLCWPTVTEKAGFLIVEFIR
jgi:hypothetical protein